MKTPFISGFSTVCSRAVKDFRRLHDTQTWEATSFEGVHHFAIRTAANTHVKYFFHIKTTGKTDGSLPGLASLTVEFRLG